MRRLIDSGASVCFFIVALPVALCLTVAALAADLAVALSRIWGRP